MRNIPQKLDDVYWAFAIYPSTADYAFQVLVLISTHVPEMFGSAQWSFHTFVEG